MSQTKFVLNGPVLVTALEDDDVAVLDLISRTGGDLSQGRKVTGSSAQGPHTEDFSREGKLGLLQHFLGLLLVDGQL